MSMAHNVDDTVSGAVPTTPDVERTAIQVIGAHPSFELVSSFFLMVFDEPHHTRKGGMIFSDCGLVVDPTADELSEIAMAASDSARSLLMEEPRVAMLSLSTNGSASHPNVKKVAEAARLVRAQRPQLAVDCDVQLDAAIIPDIAARKLPDSQVKGNANMLAFPTSMPATSATNSPNALAARSLSVRCYRAWRNRPTTSREVAMSTTSIT